MRILLVLTTVIITISSSLILDWGAENLDIYSINTFALITGVFLINAGKFSLWGFIHKNYDISDSYPLTTLFFPFILIVSYIQHEAVLSWNKIAGTIIIIFGVIIFERKKKTKK